ncbi:hypothetical protein [Streptomyces mirabilis]|uniref:hypothetical protein n=1 Tax=Streptomyces mirabilis TaxID=68239 RepID=UPI00367BF951
MALRQTSVGPSDPLARWTRCRRQQGELALRPPMADDPYNATDARLGLVDAPLWRFWWG